MSGLMLLLMHAAVIGACFAVSIVAGTLRIYFRERLSADRRRKHAGAKLGPSPRPIRPTPTRPPAKSAPNRERREPPVAALPDSPLLPQPYSMP